MKVGNFNHNWSTMLKDICNGPWSSAGEHLCGRVLDIADACSGTGAFSRFMDETFQAVRSVFGHEKTFIRKRMACEKDLAKQQFLLAHHEPELLVGGIVGLHHPMVVDVRDKDRQAAVPATSVFGSGVSCKDFVFFCFLMRVLLG